MPDVPIETPSETAIVLNSIGVAPASRMPRLTCGASARWLRLHGIVSIQVVQTPTIGLARSSSVKPIAFSIARAPARSGPSVSAALCRFAGSDGLSYGVVRVSRGHGASLDRVGRVAAPFAEGAGVEADVVASGEHELLRDDGRRHAGAAVDDELRARRATPSGSGSTKYAFRAPGMRPATGSSGSTSPRHRSGARASRSTSDGSPSRARISSRRSCRRRGRAARTSPARIAARRCRAGPRTRGRRTCPPRRGRGGGAATSSARPSRFRRRRRARTCRSRSPPRRASRRARADREADGGRRPKDRRWGSRARSPDRGGRPGHVPGVVGLARAAVDETDGHRAPFGETPSGTTEWSGKRPRERLGTAPSHRRPTR